MADWLLPLIGGLGIGSLFKGVVDHFLATRQKSSDRVYQEKRDSYMSFLQAIAESTYGPTPQKTTMAGLAKARCGLFGSKMVMELLEKYQTQKSDRESTVSEIVDAMRKDLGM